MHRNIIILRYIFYRLHKIRETGVMKRLWEKYRPQMKDCTPNSPNKQITFDLWNVMTAFMLLGFFLIFSLITLLFEILSAPKRKAHNPFQHNKSHFPRRKLYSFK